MGKAAEPPDDIGVVLGPFQVLGMAGRARQLDAAQLVRQLLRMHERQIEEFPQSAVNPGVRTAFDGAMRHLAGEGGRWHRS